MTTPVATVTGLDHIYLTVSDLERAESFYDGVFRLLDFRKGVRGIGGDPHVHYFNALLQISIRPARSKSAHDPYGPGLHHLCLRVDDSEAVDRIAVALGELGVAVDGPRRCPEYAPDYYALFFQDPDGLRLEVVAETSYRRLVRDQWQRLEAFENPMQKAGLWPPSS